MAHALRLISNKGYNCYGNGRDWFFMGDPNFRDGQRTPQPHERGRRDGLVNPAHRPRGVSLEVVRQKACTGRKGRQREKWKQMNDEVPETFGPSQQKSMEQAPLARTTSGPCGGRGPHGTRHKPDSHQGAGGAFATTYDQIGRHPKWTGDRYVLDNAQELKGIGVPRSSSEPVLKEMEGDHTRGVRGRKPHFTSTYMQVGDGVQGRPTQLVVSANAENLRDACVPPTQIPPKDREGDHSQGVKGPTADHMTTTYTELGRGCPRPACLGDMHHLHDHCEELRDAGVMPIREKPKEMEGDHSRGIRGETPHFFRTSQTYGQFQKFDGPVNAKRYDFGPIANTQYKLTKWS